MKVTLIPYNDFARDWNALDPLARQAVARVLRTLSRDPYETEFQKHCVLANNERYAYPLPEAGYVVYWKVLSNSQGDDILPDENNRVTIKLTGIERLK